MDRLHYQCSWYVRCACKGRLAGGLLFLMFLLALIPAVPGQTEDTKICSACHQKLVSEFGLSVHARLGAHELHNKPLGCGSCHGSPAKHLETARAGDIFSFKEAGAVDVERRCLSCHAAGVGMHWKQSDHSLQGVSCTQCHRLHAPRAQAPADRALLQERPVPEVSKTKGPPAKGSLAKPEVVLCLECHKTVGAKTMLSSRHPVREGKMSCSSCHDVHGAGAGNLRTLERENDLCLRCHASKQGPFVFDHAPVSENCGICHVPHGSVSNNLLKQNEPFLCLQCHESHFHIGRTGVTTPVITATGGSQNPFGESGFRRAFGTKCTQCHSQIHGSNMPSQSITSRGKSLTR